MRGSQTFSIFVNGDGTIVTGTADKSGADGSATLTGVALGNDTSTLATSTSVSGADGILSIVGGELQFTAGDNAKVGDTNTFTYTITDADGSTSTNTLTVEIGPGVPPQAVFVSSALSANESQLAGGSGVVSAPAEPTATASFTAGADDVHVTLQSISLTGAISGLTETIVSGTEIDVYQQQGANKVEIATLVLSGTTTIDAGTTGSVTVTETLLNPIEGNDGLSNIGTLNVIASDTLNGGFAGAAVAVNVVE